MIEYKNLSYSIIFCFFFSKIIIDVKIFIIFVIIIVVLVKYMFFGRVRVYRIIRMSDVFWIVRMIRFYVLMVCWSFVGLKNKLDKNKNL